MLFPSVTQSFTSSTVLITSRKGIVIYTTNNRFLKHTFGLHFIHFRCVFSSVYRRLSLCNYKISISVHRLIEYKQIDDLKLDVRIIIRNNKNLCFQADQLRHQGPNYLLFPLFTKDEGSNFYAAMNSANKKHSVHPPKCYHIIYKGAISTKKQFRLQHNIPFADV